MPRPAPPAPTWRALGSALTLLATFGCGAARAPRASPLAKQPFFVAGYHPYWAGAAWRSYPHDLIDELYFFELEADADGGIRDRHGWPEAWRPMIDDALAAGVAVTPTVSLHDADAFRRLFADPAAVERLVQSVEALVRGTSGLAGIHLDFEVFEPVDLAARDGYSTFVARLASRLDAYDPPLALSVFLPAFDDDDVYDERTVSEIADYVVVQGYDYHHLDGGRAGPVAAVRGWGRLNWSFVVDRFESFGVPARKIVMAVPMYGYRWPVESDALGAIATGPAVALPLTAPADVLPELPRAREEARRHGVRRDTESGSPWYAYQEGSAWYQGWFEDEESLEAKYDLVLSRGLGGVAIFPMAYADASHWERLRRALGRR